MMLEAARASRRARLLLRGEDEDEDEDEEDFHGEALCMSGAVCPPPGLCLDPNPISGFLATKLP